MTLIDQKFLASDTSACTVQSAEELRQMARRMLAIADLLEVEAFPDASSGSATEKGSEVADEVLVITAHKLYLALRRRSAFFDESLFGEASWDMLVDLFIQRVKGVSVSTTSLCLASGVPTTTALRWLHVLEKKGLACRRPDPEDSRVNLVSMTQKGYAAMREFLIEWTVLRN